jgi:fumagillin biosynthesis transferase
VLQFNCVKEMMLPSVAQSFQEAGCTALVYDNRSIGASDGVPRNEVDPSKQVEDYHDAVTFLRHHQLYAPSIDHERIILWGYSLAGMVALVAAALDKRVTGVIAVCPAYDVSMNMESTLKSAMQDREDRLSKGSASAPPKYLPVVDGQGLNTDVWGNAMGALDLQFVRDAMRAFPAFTDKTTVQSYYAMARWSPLHLMPRLTSSPVLLFAAERDEVMPLERVEQLYDMIRGDEGDLLTLEVVPGKVHMNVMLSDGFDFVMAKSNGFVKRLLKR